MVATLSITIEFLPTGRIAGIRKSEQWPTHHHTLSYIIIIIVVIVIVIIIIVIIVIVIIIIVIKNVVTIYHLNNCANFSFCFPVSYQN